MSFTYKCLDGVSDPRYLAAAKDIMEVMTKDPKYDDGSYGPGFIRLAWHSAGTWDCVKKTGGSNGATMRFEDGPEAKDGANAGLDVMRAILDKHIKQKHPFISYSDLWILASYVFIENSNGPVVPFVAGRVDKPIEDAISTHILPDAEHGGSQEKTIQHVRDVFCKRMGLTEREAVVLIIGGHTYGRCHTDRSGYNGKWVGNPLRFAPTYPLALLNHKWAEVSSQSSKCPLVSRPAGDNKQYVNEDGQGELMMLHTDMALLWEPTWAEWVKEYAKDGEKLKADFGAAWKKLTEFGVVPQSKL